MLDPHPVLLLSNESKQIPVDFSDDEKSSFTM